VIGWLVVQGLTITLSVWRVLLRMPGSKEAREEGVKSIICLFAQEQLEYYFDLPCG
jgi:hypothetical protein